MRMGKVSKHDNDDRQMRRGGRRKEILMEEMNKYWWMMMMTSGKKSSGERTGDWAWKVDEGRRESACKNHVTVTGVGGMMGIWVDWAGSGTNWRMKGESRGREGKLWCNRRENWWIERSTEEEKGGKGRWEKEREKYIWWKSEKWWLGGWWVRERAGRKQGDCAGREE